MRKSTRWTQGLLAAVAGSFLLWGCGGSSSSSGSLTPGQNPELPPDLGEPRTETFLQTALRLDADVDVLFVLDTSDSMVDKRAKLAAEVPMILAELSEVGTHAIAFLPAWGAPDPGAFGGLYEGSGHLYQAGTNPHVLDSTQLTAEQMNAAVSQTLLASPPRDVSTDGGEAGLYALNRLLTSPEHLALARERGFLRPGAALAVIFLSDENDICAVHPAGVTPVPDPQGNESAAREFYCTGITPAAVLVGAQTVTGGAPVLLSGVIYRPGDVVPPVGENEVGYGYLEAIELSGGVATSLAAADFAPGAQNIGNAVNALIADIQRRFPLSEGPVNPSSIEVLVDGLPVTFAYDAAVNEVLLDFAGHPGSLVEIHYRVLDE